MPSLPDYAPSVADLDREIQRIAAISNENDCIAELCKLPDGVYDAMVDLAGNILRQATGQLQREQPGQIPNASPLALS